MEDVTARPDSDPAIPTSDVWRARMRRARRDAKLTQAQLAGAVGVSQPVVSAIERGEHAGSSAILAICRVLSLPPTMLSADPELERFIAAGLTLRLRTPAVFAAQLLLIESLASAADSKTRTH